jgi:hypothetical protein
MDDDIPQEIWEENFRMNSAPHFHIDDNDPIAQAQNSFISQSVIEESLGYCGFSFGGADKKKILCDADGSGQLCVDFNTKKQSCGHYLCAFHLTGDCPKCLYLMNVASRRIIRFMRHVLIKKRLKKISRSAIIITSFGRLVLAKKEAKNLIFFRGRNRWLDKLSQRVQV